MTDPVSDRSKVLNGVIGSQEFQSKWADMSNEQLVKAAYAFVLDRVPDAQGEQNWLNALNIDHMSHQELLQGFIDSTESINITESITQNGYLVM
jgi:hypothetical protein